MLRLSKDEQKLIEFARDEFGEFIARFLLAGLGEEVEVRRWAFIVMFTDEGGSALHRSVYVEADDLMPDIPTYLPRQREPLVLLALLRLLTRGHRTPPASLSYDQEEVMSLLGWEDNEESRSTVEEAVERYFFLSYRWELGAEELGAKDLTFHRSRERIISAYGHGEAGKPGDDPTDRVESRVDFSPAFIEELVGKSLFGLNWNAVVSLGVEAVN